MLNVVIIGAGLMGRHHLKTARRLGARVVAVVDRDTAAAARLAAKAPGARSVTSLSQVADDQIDVAHICTPADSHVPVALELAAVGVHALIEKPLAETALQTLQLIEEFAKRKLLLCPVHQYAFQRGMKSALNTSGPPKRILFDIVSAGGGSAIEDLDRIAGEILPHPLAMLQQFSPAINLAALRWNVTRPEPGEWFIIASHDEQLITISISLSNRPTMFMTRLTGSWGVVEMNNFHGYAVRLGPTVSRAAKISQPFVLGSKHLVAASSNLAVRLFQREPAYPGLRELVRQFYRAVEKGERGKLPISTTDILELAQARDNILSSVSLCHG